MIPRYSLPEMESIWSENAKFSTWLEVELAVLEAQEERGLIPAGTSKVARAKAKFDLARMAEIEAQTKHDVIAFVSCVAEQIGPEGRFLHFGMTSSDLVDTAQALQLVRATALIESALVAVIGAVYQRSLEFKHTPCIGRSHGVHAEPTTFGLKLLGWVCELARDLKRLRSAQAEISFGKLSGAVGTNSSISPELELRVLSKLGLKVEPVATQVVPRDRHAGLLQAMALLATSIERACVEIRHLQRSEVFEAHEYFSPGQKGSSAMPHKRNPILSENLTGIARLLRSYSQSALENVVLWHERDISHSSVERLMLPDSFGLMYFMLRRFHGIVEKLVVLPERMLENLSLCGRVVLSGKVLLGLTEKGLSREEAYAIVQKHALAAWDQRTSFEAAVRGDSQVTKRLSSGELDQLFDVKSKLGSIDQIFDRAKEQIYEDTGISPT